MGLAKKDPLPVGAELLHLSMFVGDVIAGHGVTPLLEAARGVGCKTSDGVQMVEAGIDLMTGFFLGT
jgi:shikimate dehydrogenase